ncbi:MAG: hypothetical protein DMD86_18920 [Candidatus Rokuibacteriota bacterium]|nr:MAG: hypothetical protein DMD86_18920 [Candidatus Rokubacteria bacterium]
MAGRLAGLRVVRGRELACEVRVGDALRLAEILRADFGAELRLMAAADRRADAGRFEVYYLFAHPRENWFLQAVTPLPADNPTISSLGTFHHPASLFEREIHDLFGIVPLDHPDPRPLVRHGFWPEDFFPLRKDAGKLFEGRRPADGVELAERVSGDTSVGHALAFCQAIESAAGMVTPERAAYLRTVLLELERLYNHVADFGMIANDTGFAVAHSHCFRIRERLLRLNKRVTGHRLLRGGVIPGGVRVDLPRDLDLAGEVEAAHRDFDEIVALSLRNTLVMDRLEGTGRLTTRTARDHGVLGYVARASGLDADARRDHPFAAYGALRFRVPVFESGDVKARALVRVEEARESVALIRQAVEGLPPGPLAASLPPLPAWEPAFGMVEGWRGAILHWVMADGEGRLHRVKVVDPSFLNWRPLSYALLKNIVPDFPLCNKSFNQSYSGNDL